MLKSWTQALRLRTLPLSLSCIGMGSFLAASVGKFNVVIFSFCCLTTVFLQILSNLANDYGDSQHGADHAGRTGPQRAVQSGAISPGQMRGAVFLFAILSFLSGITLLFVAFGSDLRLLLTFTGLGLLAIAAAILYTMGRKPYGYAGLGDVSVLIFFGIVGVTGSLFLFTREFYGLSILPALSCGFFAMGVLNINNIRDIESDRAAGKYSVPVRIGRESAVRYHLLLLVGGWLSALTFTLLTFSSPWQLLFFLSLPLFIANARAVGTKPSTELDPYLKQMALSTLLFVVLFGVGALL